MLDARAVDAGIATLYRNWRDLIPILIFTALAGLYLRYAFVSLSPAKLALVLAGIGLVISAAICLSCAMRLDALSQASPFTLYALTPAFRSAYLLAWIGVAFALLCVFVLLAWQAALAWMALAWAALGFGGGIVIGFAMAALVLRVRTWPSRWLAASGSQGWRRNRRSTYAAAVLAALTFALDRLFLSFGAGQYAAAAGTALVLLFAISPVQHSLVVFQRFAGFGMGRSIAFHLRMPLIAALAMAAAGLVLLDLLAALAIAAAGAAVLGYRLLQLLLFRLYSPRASECALIGIVWIIMLLGFGFPFAVPVLLALIYSRLILKGREVIWMLP